MDGYCLEKIDVGHYWDLKGKMLKKYIGIKEKPEVMVQFYLKLVY